MSETPIYEALMKQIQPLIKSAEKMGAMRVLLAVSQHIQQRLQAGTLHNTHDVKVIMEDLEKIRTDIYAGDALGQQGD